MRHKQGRIRLAYLPCSYLEIYQTDYLRRQVVPEGLSSRTIPISVKVFLTSSAVAQSLFFLAAARLAINSSICSSEISLPDAPALR